MPNIILSDTSASVSELKKNPMATVNSGDGYPVAILNRNQPAFYCVPAELYEKMLDALDDQELVKLVAERTTSSCMTWIWIVTYDVYGQIQG